MPEMQQKYLDQCYSNMAEFSLFYNRLFLFVFSCTDNILSTKPVISYTQQTMRTICRLFYNWKESKIKQNQIKNTTWSYL